MQRLEKNASRFRTVSQWGMTSFNKNFYARKEVERVRLQDIARSNQMTESVNDDCN